MSRYDLGRFMSQLQADPIGTIYRRPDGFWGKTSFGPRPLFGTTIQEARVSLAETQELGWRAPIPPGRRLY